MSVDNAQRERMRKKMRGGAAAMPKLNLGEKINLFEDRGG